MTLTRRGFLGCSAAALLTAALPPTLFAAAPTRGELLHLRRGVGIFTSRGGTIGWLANGEGVLVVDSQYPDTAREFLAALRLRTEQGIEALVNTHHHGDHTAGNVELGRDARRVIAQRRCPELQRAAAEAAATPAPQLYADTTFESRAGFGVGDEYILLEHRGPAHTAGDATVTFERAGVVHLGDLVFNRAYPFVDRAGGASLRGWVETLEGVVAAHPEDTLYVFGHARPGFEVVGGRADVLLQRDLLAAAREAAERALARGASRQELIEGEGLARFDEHRALASWLSPDHLLGAAYDEVAAEAG